MVEGDDGEITDAEREQCEKSTESCSDDDKKKAEEAVKATQERVNKLSEEFKKSRGFDYPAENGTIPAEAKLFVQITEAEKAQLDKANAKPEEKKADAPATEEKAK